MSLPCFGTLLLALASTAGAQVDPLAAIGFLKSQNDATGPGKPYVVSYLEPNSIGLPAGTGFVYDNALAALALLHHGIAAADQDSVDRAEKILLTLMTWQDGEGWFHEAFAAGTPTQFNKPAGPAAWFAIAALQHVRLRPGHPANGTLQPAALAALAWIETLHGPTPVSPLGGYRWGCWSGASPCGARAGSSPLCGSLDSLFDVMSIEHHTAVFTAAMLAAEATENAHWLDVAEVARQFVFGMWQGSLQPDAVAPGTACGNLMLNTMQPAVDPYFLPPLAMQNDFLVPGDPQGERWSACLPTVAVFGTQTVTLGGMPFVGYEFCQGSTASCMAANLLGIHTETTAQAVLAKLVLGNTASPTVAQLLATLGAAQHLAPGATGAGLVTAITSTGQPLSTCFGFCYYAVQGVAPTAWGYFAALGVSAHYLLPAEDALDIFGQDTLSFSVSPGTHPTAPSTVQLALGNGPPGATLVLTAIVLGPVMAVPTAVLHPAIGGLVVDLPVGEGFALLSPGGSLSPSGTATLPLHLPAGASGLLVSLQALAASGATISAVSPSVVFDVR